MHNPELFIFVHTLPYHKYTTPLPIYSSCFLNNSRNYKNSLVNGGLLRNGRKRWVSAKFEVDPDKARDSLNQLDLQIEVLSNKKVNPPKVKASSVYINVKEEMKEENIEISGSFLTFIAFCLFIFSIFYNVIFLTVIKPAIDLPI